MSALLALVACAGIEAAALDNPLLTVDRSIDHTPYVGAVVERVDAGGYAYLRVDDRWVVGLDHGLEPGDQANVQPIGLAHDFHSARTGRTFDALLFAVVSPARSP